MIRRGSLETERLSIRPFVQADVQFLVRLFADPRVARFVGDGSPLAPEDARLWVRRSAENLAHHGYGTGAVIERASGDAVGWAGFARPGDGSEEIVYGLAASRWGKGYGGEIVDALVGFALERGIAPLRATVDEANAGSIAILERRGFRLAARDYGGEAGSLLYLRN
ncbi:GNAT family N-acetyltransferase [Tsuneonella sp. YG55]|uniref:GNAT family N-acetyltransferase n=1 Tax=Tsuneonella litorea TaxID=2976475 RepID=A0A9X2W4B9_9SPHN|nr:GNAT family N-acetyltransferase [Tsuneonella litorea]MCT2559780.1 GNAT family N-acetyltransferase [Tsuneonella litorea]